MSRKSLKFHIESEDYFGTLATNISLIRQTIHSKWTQEINIKNLEKFERDLIYLQKDYKIVKK